MDNLELYTQCNFQPVVISRNVNRVFNCNTLVLWNQGTQIVTIDGSYQLLAGQAITYECYPGEMNIRAYDIIFENDNANGAKLVAICKIYTKLRR